MDFDCKDSDRIRTFKTRHEDICTEEQDLANPNTKRKGFISDISVKIQVFFSLMLPAVRLRVTAKLFVDLGFFYPDAVKDF